jgi:predicted nuclease of predicted toxin-antitoxin system
MRFLANENFPLPSTVLLHNNGQDIIDVADIMPSAPDNEVLQYAYQEKRIILTFDSDYGELIYRFKMPSSGVVYFRFIPTTPLEPAEMILQWLSANIPLANQFTIAKRNKIRQRSLPTS